ncbi:two-component system response regulator [Oceanobacillus sp. E9]|uniref:LytR/AlgR family response regulator transcription factor n=1 Tax=Oceanobacillus TaxID=182709 RepID=UPI00084E7231|nr:MULTISPECIES: LytTR family transcriptional regulator DNA-binding domain-containing protein [Oceanobacillus]OEH54743.1 two-component system response regulator [Oceanobacillus sp. E9]
MKIHVMIAEDERLAREELTYLLQQENDIILCPSAENGDQLLKLYREYNPNVIFLDIHMPGINGIEIAKKLRNDYENRDIIIIFTTAYESYGVQAFEIQATDYLLKPFDEERLKIAMNRIRKALPNKEVRKPKIDKLVVNLDEKMIVIDPNQIGFAAREGRTLKIHFLSNEVIETKMNLKELEEKLSGFPFYRPHRSYLVNMDCIKEITPWFNGAYNLVIKDQDESTIPVSRTAAKGLFDALQGVDQ